MEALTRFYLIDATVEGLGERGLVAQDSVMYYEPILEEMGYSTEEFDSSVRYYSYHIGEFDKIYDQVIQELSKYDPLADSLQEGTSLQHK